MRGRHRGSLQAALCSVTCWSHHLLASQSTAPRGAGVRGWGGRTRQPAQPPPLQLSSPRELALSSFGGADKMGSLQQHPRYREEGINVCEQNASCRSCVHCNKTNGRCSLRRLGDDRKERLQPGYLLQRGQQGLGRESAWDPLREAQEHCSL